MTTEPVTTAENEAFSPVKQAWKRFLQDRFATVSLGIMALLFLAAMAAPIIANNLPLLIITEQGKWFSPALRDFF
ncbi:MAG: hypothetical protein IJ992_04605, partial [Lentisphaeria bacterium]|nr:hypothetical protein [Lentisphaeria bacterium]